MLEVVLETDTLANIVTDGSSGASGVFDSGIMARW